MMKTRLFFLALIFYSSFSFAQDKWELKKNDHGIEVYSRKLNTGKFKEIKVICEVNSSAENLIKILQDVDDHKEWVYKTIKSNLISRKNKDTLYYYSELALPWPISNRDAVVQLACSRDIPNSQYTITVVSLPNLIPAKPHIVRVPYSLGVYHVKTLPNNHIRIEYTLSVNPGGFLPSWLVNYTSTIGPYNTFFKLKTMLEN